MIVVRAPVRVSFGGGGTDLAAYYVPHGGYVVSASIARYCYAIAREPAESYFRVTSADYGISQTMATLDPDAVPRALALAAAALGLFADRGLLRDGVDLFLASEVPPGTGLGSSSAMAVAILCALAAYSRCRVDAAEIADMACRVEIERLGMPIGKQDQYASALGGINTLRFDPGGVEVETLALPSDTVSSLNSRLLLFSTGTARDSAEILREQQKSTTADPAVTQALHEIKGLAADMRRALVDQDLDRFGLLLDVAWKQKRRLSSRVSTSEIDAWYKAARGAGALGGKITGAGGGGYLMLFCREGKQAQVRQAMAMCGLQETPVAFDFEGVRIVADVDDVVTPVEADMRGMPATAKARNPRGMGPSRSVEGGDDA